jgi:ribosomal protein L37AE/L43A
LTRDQELLGKETSCQTGPLASEEPDQSIEILKEGQECPFCRFANLKRKGSEITCPICGYGYRACT